MTGDLKFDEYLRAHETGHFIQQRRLGFANFYGNTLGEYLKIGFNNVYGTPGTLEYGANIYSLKTIGYYYHNGMRYAY